MTFINTYRYKDLQQKFVSSYDVTVHGTTGMALSKVTDSEIIAIWNEMRSKQCSVLRASVRFSVGQHDRVSKEKLNFANSSEQNYTHTTQIFRTYKVVLFNPGLVYELQDILGKHIDG